MLVRSALLLRNDWKTYRLHDTVTKKQLIWNTQRFNFKCSPLGKHYSGLPGSVLFDGAVSANGGVGRWNTVAINQKCIGQQNAFVCLRAEIGKFLYIYIHFFYIFDFLTNIFDFLAIKHFLDKFVLEQWRLKWCSA